MKTGDLSLEISISEALSRSNGNASRNTYLAQNREWTLAQASDLTNRVAVDTDLPLFGIPVSLKDCFDLAGFPTTCGSRSYARRHEVAASDSWMAARLRALGAVITGKTHLHPLAYGITGENPDYGDCLQPRDAASLTGGSSSGAAASVQEGSALVAIGTDTGGSIRVPAALCGLAGYRASLGIGDWAGAAHLAESFDTMGFLCSDLRDISYIAQALFDIPAAAQQVGRRFNVGAVDEAFLYDCEPRVRESFTGFQTLLVEIGIPVQVFDASAWNESFDIFAPLQASEAALIHREDLNELEPSIAQRIAWGASLRQDAKSELHHRLTGFRFEFDRLFERFDLLLAPCAPVNRLAVGADHAGARGRILRYTTPASLAGSPVVAVPLRDAGAQLIGRRGRDSMLLHFAAQLGEKIRLAENDGMLG